MDERSGHSAVVFRMRLEESKNHGICHFERGGRRLVYKFIDVQDERIVIGIKLIQSIGKDCNRIDHWTFTTNVTHHRPGGEGAPLSTDPAAGSGALLNG
jgi:hypothetical protein